MSPSVYRFGDFELDPALFQLRRHGRPLPIQPKALDFLLFLARNRDRVVLREELIAHLWPDVAVSDASLAKAVSWARRALDDRDRSPPWIETLRGRGFRFTAPIADDDPAAFAARRRPAPRDGAASFVGREDVLDLLTAAVADAAAGSARLVLLAGAAGMGKTSTALEAASRSAALDAASYVGWCPELAGSPDLWPWLEVVRQLVEDDPELCRFGEVDDALGDLATLVPSLRDHVRAAASATPLAPEHARFRLFETIAELFERATRERAVLVVLDDFHWSDRASQELLRFLARRLAAARLALLVTHREEALADDHVLHELRRLPSCTPIALAGLDRAETARLVRLELGESIEPDVCDSIHERSGGNPFFAKELARTLAASGQLTRSAADASLPSGVREVLRRRLERLPPRCRDLLVLASLLGGEFEIGELARVAEQAPEPVLEALDEARGAGLIRVHGSGFQFEHALFRDALLERVPAIERARLHRRIGEMLELHHAGNLEPQLARLARHFADAAAVGGAERAIDYARRAGDRAAARLAWDEAAVHYRRALDVQGLAAVVDQPARGALQLALGESLMASGQTRLGREALARAADLARIEGRGDWLARAALAAGGMELSPEVGVPDVTLARWLAEALERLPADPSVLRIRLLVRLAIVSFWCGDTDRTGELYERALVDARRLGDPEALCYALYGQRWGLVGTPDVETRLAVSSELLENGERAGRRDLELAGRSCRFLDLVELGRIAEADHELAVYARLATDLRVARYRIRTLLYRAMRAQMSGRLAEAEELARRALADGQRIGAEDAESSFGALIALVRREQGRFDELEPAIKQLAERFPTIPSWRTSLALAHLEIGREADARDEFAELMRDRAVMLPSDRFWIVRLVILAELAAGLDEAESARRIYATLLPHASRAIVVGAGVGCWGSMDRILGLLATTLRDWERAEHHFDAAKRLDVRMGSRPWLGWTEHDRARMLALRDAAGDRERAREHLAHASEIADAMALRRLAARTAELRARL